MWTGKFNGLMGRLIYTDHYGFVEFDVICSKLVIKIDLFIEYLVLNLCGHKIV